MIRRISEQCRVFGPYDAAVAGLQAGYQGAILITAGCGLALLLAGCQGLAPGEPKPDASAAEIVKARASERMAAVIAGDFGKAYQYLTPGYRSTMSSEEYGERLARRATRYEEFSIDSVDCGRNLCEVDIRLTYSVQMRHAGRMRVPHVLDEQWINTRGQWWYKPTAE